MNLEQISDEKKRQIGIIAVFLIGIFLLAVGAGLFFFKNASSTNEDIQIISSDSDTGSESEVIVHVDGAVAAPGVYKLAGGSRVGDAIAAAGGLTSEADQTRINLAAKVSDGQKIYIPKTGESVSQGVGGSVSQIAGESVININTASESELDKLPGIGPVTAGKIIASRPYNAPEDLKTKKVVSASLFEKIREMITVY